MEGGEGDSQITGQKGLDSQDNRRIVSRRAFLKGAAAATAAVALSPLGFLNAGAQERLATPEIQYAPTIAAFDFFNIDSVKDAYIKSNFPQDFSVHDALAKMGVTDPNSTKGLLEAVPTTPEEEKLLMISLFTLSYRDHGNSVINAIDVIRKFLLSEHKTKDPKTVSIANAVKIGGINHDTIGNPILDASISPKAIDELISSSQECVINMSFEVGDFSSKLLLKEEIAANPNLGQTWPQRVTINGKSTYTDAEGNLITYEIYEEIIKKMNEKKTVLRNPERRIVRQTDGYAGKDTEEHVRLMINLARKHPQKIFIAAAGNPTYTDEGTKYPDIRSVRAELERKGEWPNNIIFVGVHLDDESINIPLSKGADIYVSHKDLESQGLGVASSFATPVIAEIVRQLIADGSKTPEAIKQKMKLLSKVSPLSDSTGESEYRTINLGMVLGYLTGILG